MRRDFFVALGLLLLTVVILTVAFRSTDGCRPESWWTDWNSLFPPYVVPAALSLAGAMYFCATALSARRQIALASAGAALLLGGFGIWFLALLDGLVACPP